MIENYGCKTIVDIFVDLIHEATSLSKKDSVPIGEKMIKKKVES